MSTRNVRVPENLDRLIESGIASGRFRDAGEVICEGLRLLEQREREDKVRVDWLRAAAKVGFDAAANGDFVSLTTEGELDAFFEEIHAESLP